MCKNILTRGIDTIGEKLFENKNTKKNTAEDYHDEIWNNHQSKIRQEYYNSYNPSGKD